MTDNDGEEKLLYLLRTTTSYLPKSYLRLKSYLNIHSSFVAAKYQMTLPKFLTSKNISCPYCLTEWKDNASTFKLCPSNDKKFQSTALKKTKKSEKQASEQTRNKLVLKCKVCLRKSKFSLAKPIKPKTEVEDKDNNVGTQKGRRKNKKKKKKCANLSVKACLDAGHSFKIKKGNKKKQSMQSMPNGTAKGDVKSDAQKAFINSGSTFRNPYATNHASIRQNELRENKKSAQGGGKKVKYSFPSTTFQKNGNSLKSRKTTKKKINNLNALKKAIREVKKQEKCSFKDFLNVIG